MSFSSSKVFIYTPGCKLIRTDLAVLLIEVCFCKPLQALRIHMDMKDGMPNAFTDFATAGRLLDEVKNNAGLNWVDAIRRCVYCDFDQHDCSLDNPDFRLAAYQGIVEPLVKDLKYFHGGSIPSQG